MAEYPVRPSTYEVRDGRLVRIDRVYNDETGVERDVVRDPNDPTFSYGGLNEISPTEGTPEDAMPLDLNRPVDNPNLPGFTTQGASRDPWLGSLTGTPGQTDFSQYTGPENQQYTGPGSNWGSQYGGQNMAQPNVYEYGQPRMPTTSAPGQMGPSAATNTTPGGTGVSDADRTRGALMYGLENPMTAMENVLMDMGAGRGFGNPFVQYIKRAAPGLALAFAAQNALQPGLTGEAAAANPFDFRDFLRSAIGGGGGTVGSGNAFSTMQSAAASLPQLIEAVRGLNSSTATGMAVNPFLESIAASLDSNFGKGTTDFMSTLLGPLMPRSIAGGYQQGLESRLLNAQRARLGRPGEPVPSGDIWSYLMPR